MSAIRVLALSSSRVGNSAFLEAAVPIIEEFIGDGEVNIAFIPFAAADNDYDNYLYKVREGLSAMPYEINVTKPENAKDVIEQSDVLMVGGGNTFKLLHDLYHLDLVELIKKKVNAGTAYVGWSAGANLTGLTIGTTNDMPIIEPKSFKALGFLPFQINPHYINVRPEGHNGETRNDRLNEYLKVNPGSSIVGLPEGTGLQLKNNSLKLIGTVPAVLFQSSVNKEEETCTVIKVGADLSYLM